VASSRSQKTLLHIAIAGGYFVIAPYGTLLVILPLMGGGTVGRRRRGLEVAARLRGGGGAGNREGSWLGGA